VAECNLKDVFCDREFVHLTSHHEFCESPDF
jgi:hypothetical protein